MVLHKILITLRGPQVEALEEKVAWQLLNVHRWVSVLTSEEVSGLLPHFAEFMDSSLPLTVLPILDQ
jgi:hypothetical protein